jgi:hypothetical protein
MAWAGSRGLNTTAAGYGSQHQRLRKALLAKAYGQPCSRCGLPMLPGQALHLDHDDYDRTRWRGFSHAKCNLRAAAKKARAIQLKRWRGGGMVPQATTVHRW